LIVKTSIKPKEKQKMPKTNFQTFNGNQAAAHVAFALSEAAAIYPITPSSDMAEYCDIWASEGKQNIFGTVPKVVEMQSEAGAAGTLHGMLSGGVLASTFTASQGLLLMIPNMYKICGELLPCVIHVSARSLASHALSIFGDHSDIYSIRSTGFAMLSSNSVQESMDMSLVAHLSSIEAHYPFLHFFDGFRTSHEFNKIGVIDYSDIKKLVNTKKIAEFRKRALNPTHPHQQGTAQNPDTYFQNREACNKIVASLPETVQKYMDEVGKITGRTYKLFDYVGASDATHVTIAMGSGCETIEETIVKLNAQGAKVGLIKVRLFRPFSATHLLAAIPQSCKTLTILDRTKENGAIGDPLYLDVCAALLEYGRTGIKVLAGRYGLSSKEFTPDMVAAIYENKTKTRFTVGINDDVTNTHLEIKPREDLAEEGGYKFFGLGSDGTVGANRNSCAIVGDNTDMFAQAYFVYDSKKSGGITTSHLRFGKNPIRSTYLINYPSFVACHNQSFLTRFDMLKGIKKGGTFLLNTTYTREELENVLPVSVKRTLAEKQINFYTINAYKIATELGMGRRINTVMQSAFFKLANVMPYETAKKFMKEAAQASYGNKGQKVLDMNFKAIDSADTALEKIAIPANWATATGETKKKQSGNKYYDEFCTTVSTLRGNELPVSAFSPDGRVPTSTSQYEKRSIATTLPEWLPEHCIQCNHCALVCPHCCLRPHLVKDDLMKKAPKSFKTLKANGFEGNQYKIQLSPEDCTGCGMCANVCPSKTKALVMKDYAEVNETENYAFSLTVPYPDVQPTNVKNSQFLKPYFEFSGACAGCGETQYIKLASQLFGKRMIVANATGCTSIYCGSSPTCPYTTDEQGHGPAWANSLFEDNAEFGFGIEQAYELRTATGEVKQKPSVWIIGGDGWAYDIGFGGLDHVLNTTADVNLLVLDTEVYSNTGGQASKATPSGSIAKFAAGGKPSAKKDLGAMAMNYDHVYVAQVAIGADMNQCLRAFREAEAHKGPSLIIAYSTCINHGIDMSQGMKVMKNAVECGYWTLYRRDPKVGLVIDSKAPNTDAYIQFLQSETRYKALEKINPDAAKRLFKEGEQAAKKRHERYEKLAVEKK
jgi:pyruvate-ferredoxin/flavodoxin oxidoreductase